MCCLLAASADLRLMFFSSLRISSSLETTCSSYLIELFSLSHASMLPLRSSISASARALSSLNLISMLERSCNDLDRAPFSAADLRSSCSKFAIFASSSPLILSNCLVFERATSCIFRSCSSLRFRICRIHSLRAPSKCVARSSAVSFKRVTDSR
ncbi:hypothetical protein V8G54_006246 [Vigna mungo]|uniref:Uncharacterized protein n=1 Tax=Vigna mungo TaxID=3915 RepID=A0AAQ3S4D5_VIGMU